ncbi:MAG TPA: hypothetical protein VFO36_05425 [Nitrospiraceae bacterium]|nr:hypothetical protein [Nitrospiraceae bacterium]
MEQNLVSGSERENEQPQGSPVIKHDLNDPSPEFMRLLVMLGEMAERERRREPGTVGSEVSPER